MNGTSPEGAPESQAGEPGVRKMIISGTVVENALEQLRGVDPDYAVAGADQNQLDRDIFRFARQAGKAESPEEEQRLSREADALGKIRDLSRSNNSIKSVERDKQGNVIGIKVEIRELPENPK